MWYSRETAPEPGNRFRLRLRCVRAKLRVRDDSAVARVGQINLSAVQLAGRLASAVPGHFLCFRPGFFDDVQLSLTSFSNYRSP